MENVTQNPVTVVTGGAQGIGKAVVMAFLQTGHRVVLADIDDIACAETNAEFATLGPLLTVPTDVGREAHVAALVAATIERFGRVDNLINNAAIAHNRPLSELTLSQWDAVLRTNLTGPLLCSKHFAAHLSASRGNIVNIASTRAYMSEAHTEAYSASKGGLLALTHALSISLGPEVRVNSISPGWIEVRDWQRQDRQSAPELRPLDHNQHPAGRVGVPADVARAVLFLCAQENGFITGQDLVVDGGMTRKMIYAEG